MGSPVRLGVGENQSGRDQVMGKAWRERVQEETAGIGGHLGSVVETQCSGNFRDPNRDS